MKKILAMIVALAMVAMGANTPVMATRVASTFGDDNLANVLTDCGDPNNKDGIGCVLKLVVEILSIGVGILAVVGISVSGIQYLTAGGSEEKTRKAKRRIFEIVIGLALYVILYALLQWLLPGFKVG